MPWARDACPKALPSLGVWLIINRARGSLRRVLSVLLRDSAEATIHCKNAAFLLAQTVRELNPRGSPEASPEASPGTSPEAFPKSNFIGKM